MSNHHNDNYNHDHNRIMFFGDHNDRSTPEFKLLDRSHHNYRESIVAYKEAWDNYLSVKESKRKLRSVMSRLRERGHLPSRDECNAEGEVTLVYETDSESDLP